MGFSRKKVRKTRIMEKIITFLPDQLPGGEVFTVEMTGITYPDSRYHIERENSPLYCLEYVIEGKGSIRMDGRQYEPTAGDVYLLARGKDHSYRSDAQEPWKKIWMNVKGSLCDTLVKGYGLEDTVLFRGRPLYPLFLEFLSVCERREGGGREVAKRTALLFHEILLNLTAQEAAGGSTLKKLPEQAIRARSYVDEHIYERLTIGRLAKSVNLSASQLTRVFGKAYGQSPYEYVLSRKIDTACLLLRNTGLPVKEIAYRLNFADEHYFSRLFCRKMGIPPGRYKEGHGGKNQGKDEK